MKKPSMKSAQRRYNADCGRTLRMPAAREKMAKPLYERLNNRAARAATRPEELMLRNRMR